MGTTNLAINIQAQTDQARREVQNFVASMRKQLASLSSTTKPYMSGTKATKDAQDSVKQATANVNQYKAAQQSLHPVMSQTEKYLTKQHQVWQVHSKGVQGFVSDMRNMMLMQMRWFSSAAILTGIPTAFIKAAKDFAEFEQNLQSLKVILGLTDEQAQALGLTIRQVGKETVLGASGAAKAALLFAQAGLNAKETGQALQVAGKLMAMPGANLDSIVKSLTTVMHAFKYEAKDMTKIADVLAKSTDLATLNIQDLGTVFNFLASQSSLAGVKLEEMMSLVVALSKMGVAPSTIGTGLSQFFTELLDMQPRLRMKLSTLGLDPEKFRLPANNIMDILQQLQKSGIGVSDIFESMEVRSARALSGLVNTGASELRKIQAELTNSGYLATFWGEALKGTAVQAKLFYNNLADLTLSIGQEFNPAIKTSIGLLTNFVAVLNEIFQKGAFTQKRLDEMGAVSKVLYASVASVISGLRLMWYTLEWGANTLLAPIIAQFKLFGKTLGLLGAVLTGAVSIKDAWKEFLIISDTTVAEIEKTWGQSWEKITDKVYNESVDLNQKLASLFSVTPGKPEIPLALPKGGKATSSLPERGSQILRAEIEKYQTVRQDAERDIKRIQMEILTMITFDPFGKLALQTQEAIDKISKEIDKLKELFKTATPEEAKEIQNVIWLRETEIDLLKAKGGLLDKELSQQILLRQLQAQDEAKKIGVDYQEKALSLRAKYEHVDPVSRIKQEYEFSKQKIDLERQGLERELAAEKDITRQGELQLKLVELENREKLAGSEAEMQLREYTGGAGEGFIAGLEGFYGKQRTIYQQMRDLGHGTAQSIQDGFANAFYKIATMEGFDREQYESYWQYLKDVADQFYQQIYLSFLKMLSDMVAEWTMAMIKMLILKIIAMGVGGPVGAGVMMGVDLTGATANIGHEGGLIMHQGGIIPRYHSGGGLGPQERLSILEAGEFVINRKATARNMNTLTAINQGKDVGGGVTNIIINATDPKSWRDYVRRNPGPIIEAFSKDMRLAGSSRSGIRAYS